MAKIYLLIFNVCFVLFVKIFVSSVINFFTIEDTKKKTTHRTQRKIMNKKLSIFWSKGFIIGLLILLLNDHILKAEFHNWITGKLSDAAGLFIFPLFFAAFFAKYKKHIYWIITIGFIWWKSPLSNEFIELLNLYRVLDYTDLLALLILPLSYHYFAHYKKPTFKLYPLPILLISTFAFISSQPHTKSMQLNTSYKFPYGKEELVRRLNLVIESDGELPISTYIENINDTIFNYNNDTLCYYASSFSKINGQMIADKWDTIYPYKDVIVYSLKSTKYFNISENKRCGSVIVKVKITGNNQKSKLTLIKVNTIDCSCLFKGHHIGTDINKLQTVFGEELNREFIPYHE